MLAAGVLAVGLAVIFILMPKYTKVRKARANLTLLESELSLIRQALDNNRRLQQKGELLSRSEISKAIEEITTLGAELNINFLSTNPKKIYKPEGSKYPVLPISLELQSDYDNIGRFLGALESLNVSIVTVREFRISRDTSILPQVYTEILLDIYLKENERG